MEPNQIDLSKSKGIECECGGIFFEQTVLLRKFSRLYTGTSEDAIIPVAAFRCQQCGEVCKDYFPRGMTDVEEKLGLKDPEPVKDQVKSKLIQM